ncbi:hypothetical protein GUITHDRAFT_118387 [Guillardia theta CCMP2712]|uniref:G domain-containing protein n=1 Tax=Guillardia theta (strain CCMP2712) TaxID=905079 RepID=L1IGT1_GUITC|nr:hypothetical protein GUITHDRAFT_118387 [Guillardia theta CCMP2712]EKX35471.1 hypothetical protein GUITHDRAFT_118387 [Guillardia theta CCMP2712]|eukprot:XP_005822451.1 hypothetical protein GUITHDRAFT_118387 [Guillardia theta CCMP2712]
MGDEGRTKRGREQKKQSQEANTPKKARNSLEDAEEQETKIDIDIQTLNELVHASSEQIKKAAGMHCIMVIGKTGIGKSTILTAMIKGMSSLHAKKERGAVHLVSEGDPITDDHGNEIFVIGHDRGKSQTDVPGVYRDAKRKVAICDCPGFKDTRGKTFEIANAINISGIITVAKSVTIVAAFPYASIASAEGRGDVLRELLQSLRSIFSVKDEDLSGLEAVIPLVLKTPKLDEGGDQVTIENLREMFLSLLSSNSDDKMACETLAKNLVATSAMHAFKEDTGLTNADDLMDLFQTTRCRVYEALHLGLPLTQSIQSDLQEIYNDLKETANVKMAQVSMDQAEPGDFAAACEEEMNFLKVLRKYKVPGADRVLNAIRATTYRRKKTVKQQNTNNKEKKLTRELDNAIAKIDSDVWEMIGHDLDSVQLPDFNHLGKLKMSIKDDPDISESQRSDLLAKIRTTRQKAMQMFFNAMSQRTDRCVRSFHYKVMEQANPDVDAMYRDMLQGLQNDVERCELVEHDKKDLLERLATAKREALKQRERISSVDPKWKTKMNEISSILSTAERNLRSTLDRKINRQDFSPLDMSPLDKVRKEIQSSQKTLDEASLSILTNQVDKLQSDLSSRLQSAKEVAQLSQERKANQQANQLMLELHEALLDYDMAVERLIASERFGSPNGSKLQQIKTKMEQMQDSRYDGLIQQVNDKIRSSADKIGKAKLEYDVQILTEKVNSLTDEIKNSSYRAHPPPVFPFTQQVGALRRDIASLESSSGKQLKHLSSRLTGAVDQWQQMGKEKRDSAAVQQREQKAYEEYERFRKEIKRAKAAYKKAFFDNMDREKLMLPDATNLNQLLTTIERSTILQGNEKKREQLVSSISDTLSQASSQLDDFKARHKEMEISRRREAQASGHNQSCVVC